MRFFVFLPWLTFWSQGGSRLVDYSHLNVGVASNASCKNVLRKYRTVMVRTEASREKGLGGRSQPLARDEGMLFVFDVPQLVAFWMKDTLIPLELVMFDAKGRVTQAFEMPVEKDPRNPLKRYVAMEPAATALELPPGSLVKKLGHGGYLCVDSLTRQ